MKAKLDTIIYLEFLDHSSLTNAWQTREEFESDCCIEPCRVVGFYEKEDKDAFYLSTMKSETELGSGHIILKSTVTYSRKIPLKSILKGVQHLFS